MVIISYDIYSDKLNQYNLIYDFFKLNKYKHFYSYNIKKYEKDYIYLINKYETIKEESNNELQDNINTKDLDIELLNIIKSLFPDELIIKEIKQTKEQNNNNQNNKMNLKTVVLKKIII